MSRVFLSAEFGVNSLKISPSSDGPYVVLLDCQFLCKSVTCEKSAVKSTYRIRNSLSEVSFSSLNISVKVLNFCQMILK